jgi:tyrosyl-tRNA synthetase
MGRHLQPQFGQEGQVVMLCPLLVGTDGKEKMSQSLGNYVSVVDTPNDMYGKTMSIPDSILVNWFELCTDVPMEEVHAMLAPGQNPRDGKRRLAREIVALYHSAEAAAGAEEYFVSTFSKREQPVEAEEAAIPESMIGENGVYVAGLIAALGLTKSIGEARRLMEGGGVSLDGERLLIPTLHLDVSALRGKVLRAGKLQFRKLL